MQDAESRYSPALPQFTSLEPKSASSLPVHVMRVFVTGASGFIGQAVVKELLGAGHQVLGLVRSDKGADSLSALGAEVHKGDLEDLESLKQGASASDAVIHLAFIHDFSDYVGNCAKDRVAIEAIGSVLVGTDRPFIITSGTLLLPPNRLATEDTPPDVDRPAGVRGKAEQTVLAFASQGVRPSIIRLPPTNHGEGDHGFIAMLVNIAKAKGVSAYIGDGSQRWPAIHRLDTAKVYQLAVEKAKSGDVLHAVAEEGVTIKEIAEAIGKQLNLPVVSKSAEEAQEHFGFLAMALVNDNPTSSEKTREQLGWKPVHSTLIADIEKGIYTKS